jgi:hypothetical protein
MKRCAGAFAALACIALLPAPGAAAAVGVRATGGLSYVSYGDFNDAAEYANSEAIPASGGSGEINTIHWIPEFGGEIFISVLPRLSVAAGGGILFGKSAYEMETGLGSYSYEHAMKAYPVTVTAYLDLPPLPFAKTNVFLGAGAYRTNLSFDESASGGSSPEEASADLAAWGFGVHGGAALEFAIAPTVQLEVGVKLRYAVVTGFEGDRTNPDGSTAPVFLASYTDADGVVTFAPESTADRDVYGEGSVDLSGVAFQIGITVTF